MVILDKLRELGYRTVPEDFYKHIDLWWSWYQGNVPKFHEYSVFNGIRRVKCRKLTAGMAKMAAEDWADMLMNEKVVITLEGEAEQAFLDEICKRNNFERMMNLYEEYCFGLGSTAYVLRVSGLTVDEEGRAVDLAQSLKIDFIMANGIFPLSWENGTVMECAFSSTQFMNNHRYCYLQIHRKEHDGTYVIENHLYQCDNSSDNMQEVKLASVPGFSDIAPVFYTHSDRKLFVINTPNIANNIDPDVPLGISVYANGIDQLMFCDDVFNSGDTEISLGRKRVMVKPEATKSMDGEPLFDPNDIAFYILPEDSQNGQSVQEIQSTLRMSEHVTAMQMALNMFSMKCGFGPNHWKFDANGNIVTATQVISANSEEFRTLKKHEIVLNSVLMELIRIILRLGNEFMGQHLNEDVEISIDFDDSIIEDEATEFSRDMTMLTSGIIKREEFRAKWMNEDEETAKAALPQLEGMIQDESGADEV